MPYRRLLIGLAAFSTLSAVGGGLGLIARPGNDAYLPLELLRYTPFASFVVPGLLLAIAVGGSSLTCTICAWRRSRATIDVTLIAGGALSLWILAEVALLRAFHVLHAVYGGLGLALSGLGVLAALRSEQPRHRWTVGVTLAEAAGVMAPMSVAIAGYRAGLDETTLSLGVVAAGLVEGLALGSGQAWAFPLPLRRGRYALLTAVGAAVVWAGVLWLRPLFESDALPRGLLVAVLPLAAVIGLGAIGAAQWLELRKHAPAAHRFIGWTALAWAVALPLSFLPGPLLDESTPLPAQLALFFCGGVLMAYAMALVTWQGARGLIARRAKQRSRLPDGPETATASPRRSSCVYS